MALTPSRAAAVALVLCAGAVTLLLPPQPRRLERDTPYLRAVRDQAGRELSMTRRAIAVRMLRDSARGAAARNAQPVTAMFLGAWTPAETSWLGDRVTDIVGTGNDAGRAAVVFVRDSVFRGFPGLYYALPDSSSDVCVALYGEGVLAPGPWMRPPPHRRVAAGLLGPCAYHARFGQAGAAVGDWLREGGAALALTSPTFPAPAWRPPPPPPMLVRMVDGPGNRFVEPRLPFPLALDACLGGSVARCTEFVMGRRPGNRHLHRLGIHEEYVWSVRADAAAFLSDVLVAFGPERFARFWRASGSMPGAFEQAFGLPLGEWVFTWATGRFGSERERAPAAAGVLVWSLGTVAGFVGLAVLVASRRRVGA
jgi:hypothetical protein